MSSCTMRRVEKTSFHVKYLATLVTIRTSLTLKNKNNTWLTEHRHPGSDQLMFFGTWLYCNPSMACACLTKRSKEERSSGQFSMTKKGHPVDWKNRTSGLISKAATNDKEQWAIWSCIETLKKSSRKVRKDHICDHTKRTNTLSDILVYQYIYTVIQSIEQLTQNKIKKSFV